MLEFKKNNIYVDFFKDDEERIKRLQNDIINQIQKQQEEFIIYILRNHVNPPIKGEITKGKMKWRGIVIINDFNYSKMWVRQRGIDIPIYFDYSFKSL